MPVNGEYWIDDGGTVIFCDGDTGVDVPNHEMVVVQQAWVLFTAAIDACENKAAMLLVSTAMRLSGADDEGELPDVIAFRTALNDESDKMGQAGQLTEDQTDDVFSWLNSLIDIEEWVFAAATNGMDCNFDLRAWATAKWAWIRVAGNNVVIPTITKEVCNRLADGLAEICETEGLKDFEEYAWNIEAVKPSASVMGISGALVGDHKTLRHQMVKHHVPGWTTD